jgi:hypothetical protein
MNFIEIGCNDYDTVLHSRFFSTAGWGIMIEPLTRFLDNLPRYPNVKYLDCALTAYRDGESIFYAPIEQPSPWWVKSIGSLHAEHATLEHLGIKNQTVQTTVKIMSLDTLYDLIPDNNLHLLKIDTEGTDFELLMAWDFDRFMPLQIQFESKLMQPHQLDTVSTHLGAQGYCIMAGNKRDYNQVPYNHIAVLEI